MKPKRKRGKLSGNQAISVLIVLAILVVIGSQLFLTVKESKQLDLQATEIVQNRATSVSSPTRTPFVEPTQMPTQQPTQDGPEPIILKQVEEPAIVQKRDWASGLAMALSPDGRFIATSDNRLDVLHVYEIASGEETIQLLGLFDIVRDIAWSPDSQQVAAADIDGHSVVWDVASGDVILDHKVENGSYEVGWAMDGSLFAAISAFDLSVWDTATWEIVYNQRVGAPISMAWSPVTLSLAFTDAEELFRITWDGDASSTRKILDHGSNFADIDIAPDGRTLAAIDENNQLLLYEWPSGVLRYALRGHIADQNHVSWSPNSQYVITSSDDETARIWDVATGRTVYILEAGYRVNIAEWSPDFRVIYLDALYTTIWPNPLFEE